MITNIDRNKFVFSDLDKKQIFKRITGHYPEEKVVKKDGV